MEYILGKLISWNIKFEKFDNHCVRVYGNFVGFSVIRESKQENYVEVDNIKNEQQVNMQDIYESFEQYYFNRVQKDKIAKEDIEMENGI